LESSVDPENRLGHAEITGSTIDRRVLAATAQGQEATGQAAKAAAMAVEAEAVRGEI
jgi:hypothetical protein